MSAICNIGSSLQEIAGRYGDRRALVEAATGRELSFAELNNLSDGYAHYFRKSGVGPGQRVMLMVRPSADFIALTFAFFKLGAPVILIDPGMGYKNLLRCIERVEPEVLVGIPKALLFAKFYRRTFSRVKKFFCCGKSFGLLGADIRQKVLTFSSSFPVYQPQKSDLAAIIFTTGSTGAPKGVRYEHDLFAAQRYHVGSYYGIGPGDVDQPGFPLFALFSTSLGACAVIPDMDPTRPAQVDAKKYLDSIDRYGVTYSFGSPAIWNVVSRYALDHNRTVPTLQKVLMAGAPVPGELLERVTAILPAEANIYTPYGATESLPIVSITGREILAETWEKSRQGAGTCVGRALPGIEIRVVAIDDGQLAHIDDTIPLAVGEIGEIIVRGNVVTRAYDHNPEATALAKITGRNSGEFWHRMGDTGYLDEQGRLWFCGRKAHRVVLSSRTLFTIPCEALANEHPAVLRSALVGVEKQGEVAAVMILELVKDSCSPQKVVEEVRGLLKANRKTECIDHLLIHPSFPVDIRHNAKIFREKLAVWAEEKLAQ